MTNYIVATERLGWPGSESTRAERRGFLHKRLEYPTDPTATCHLLEGEREPAPCGYPWESLVAIPSRPAWTELHPELRCVECPEAAGGAD